MLKSLMVGKIKLRKSRVSFVIKIDHYKTSIGVRSSKRIELSGVPNTGVVETHNPGTIHSSLIDDHMDWKLRKDKRV